MTSRAALAAWRARVWTAPQPPRSRRDRRQGVRLRRALRRRAWRRSSPRKSYTQHLLCVDRPDRDRPGQTRRLKSDFMLVKFKDGRAVDSVSRRARAWTASPSRDRDARLEHLFLQPGAEAATERRAHHATKARGTTSARLRRNVNVPVLALEYLRPVNAARCRFQQPHREHLDGDDAWRIDFKELDRTRRVIRDARNGENVPAAGTFWMRDVGRRRPADDRKMANAITIRDRRALLRRRVAVLVPCRMPEHFSRGERSRDATYATSDSSRSRPPNRSSTDHAKRFLAVASSWSPPAAAAARHAITPSPAPTVPISSACSALGSTVPAVHRDRQRRECSTANSPVVLLNMKDRDGQQVGIVHRHGDRAARDPDGGALPAGDDRVDQRLSRHRSAADRRSRSRRIRRGARANSTAFDVGVVLMPADIGRAPVPLLLSRDARVGETAILAGWGKDAIAASPRRCAPASRRSPAVTALTLQTTFTTTVSSVCQGDSGGPILLSGRRRRGRSPA